MLVLWNFTKLHNRKQVLYDCKDSVLHIIDLIFFLVPQKWDRGKGFDYSTSSF